jgi:adenine/guanine phosphoribosyltransferase-like PRPP-binding protein
VVVVGAETTGVPFAAAVVHRLADEFQDRVALLVWSKASPQCLPPPHVTTVYAGSNVTRAGTELTLVGAVPTSDADEPAPFVVFVDDTVASGATLEATHRALRSSSAWKHGGYDLALFAFGLPLLRHGSAAIEAPPCETFAAYALLQ